MHEEYQRDCPECGETLSRSARHCSQCGVRVRRLEAFETPDDYVRIEELHPACVRLPCRYDGCPNEEWVCGSGSTHDFTVCRECYDGPDVSKLFDRATVRIGSPASERL